MGRTSGLGVLLIVFRMWKGSLDLHVAALGPAGSMFGKVPL